MSKNITTVLPDELYRRIEEVAKSIGTSKSWVVKYYLTQGLEKGTAICVEDVKNEEENL